MAWLRNPLRSAEKSSAKAGRLKGASKYDVLDSVTAAVMTVDRDFVVTYVNNATMELLRSSAMAFRTIWPDFDPEKIVGKCIDGFHKSPEHQRRMLSDPTRLPFRTEITVADLKIKLNVSGLFDNRGQYVGNILVWMDATAERHNAGVVDALERSQAVIEFKLDGTIITANENFLKVFGYSLAEVRGQHHRMFVDPIERATPAYRAFWEKLGRGEAESGQYRRVSKSGKELWIQGIYYPILDGTGKPYKVVKLATDLTAQVGATRALELAVRQTQAAVEAAKAHDLTQRIPLDGKVGEIEALCTGVNGLLDTMTAVISEIKATAREVANASAEISASTTDLSQRTEEQAASLEQTSASMEEISSTVKKNAENAERANQLTSGSRDIADRGGIVVADAVKAMARIEDSSRKIADIIGVIDEIARQTNLLALNAAVEAARAGDAGRGFAVVASEVRSLAQRSSQAAKDIKDLITNSSSQVKEGVGLVNQAGTSLNEIVISIKQVAEIVADITSASAEQAERLEQVNKALAQMDEVTQQNSALVEENAASAKALEQQSTSMDERVALFHIGSEFGSCCQPRPKSRPGARTHATPQRAQRTHDATGPFANCGCCRGLRQAGRESQSRSRSRQRSRRAPAGQGGYGIQARTRLERVLMASARPVAAPAPLSLPDPQREFEFSAADFRALAKIAYDHAGITLPEAKKNLVYGRLSRRLRVLGLSTFEEYRRHLAEDGERELELFINALSTNHTKFFREQHHFEHFSSHVVAPFVAANKSGGRLRIWSAGCSSGEEPHTIALILNAEINNTAVRDVRILATDIDTDVLRRASLGVFAAEAVEAVPPKYRGPLSKVQDDDKVAIDRAVCSLITFGHLNLMNEWPVRGPFDAIFCRNVMIYFDQATKAKLVERFTDLLRIGGWLYIGHSESLIGSHPRLKLSGRTIYRRTA